MVDGPAPSVVGIIVTYNRRELLRECLAALAAQTRPPDRVIVVDNASTDGSGELVRAEFPAAELVTLARNTGGAGGFAFGIERALVNDATDFLWLMDDDTVPTPTALAESLGVVAAHPELVLAASKAVWTDGSEHPMNRPRRRPGVGRAALERAANAGPGAYPVRFASFVALLLRAEALREHDPPIADYFIWGDDLEYTMRLLRRGEGWYLPSSIVEHRTAKPGSSDVDPGERFFYEVRNKLWLLRFSRGLGPVERLGFAGATALRWLRTWRRSHDRATLCAAGGRGWRSGWHSRPRPNADVLDGVRPA